MLYWRGTCGDVVWLNLLWTIKSFYELFLSASEAGRLCYSALYLVGICEHKKKVLAQNERTGFGFTFN